MLALAKNRVSRVSVVALLLTYLINHLCTAGPTTRPRAVWADTADGITATETLIVFIDAGDLTTNNNILLTTSLYPGRAVRFGCNTTAMRNFGTFDILPEDPLNYTLIPRDDSLIEDNVKLTVENHQVFRSDTKLVAKADTQIDGASLIIMYPKNALIMARDPENFSLNFACKYEPKDKSIEPMYRWVKVTFKHVYPLAYGCESGNNVLFKNSVPIPKISAAMEAHMRRCEIEPEPNMVIGLYCQPGEKVYPPACLHTVVLDKYSNSVKFDKNMVELFDFNSTSESFRLVRMPAKKYKKNVFFSCKCVNDKNITTKIMVVRKQIEYKLNLVRKFTTGGITVATGFVSHHHIMEPGRVLKLTVNANNNIKLLDGTHAHGRLVPENAEKEAIVLSESGDTRQCLKFDEILGTRGFSIAKVSTKEGTMYKFSYDKSAILVSKRPTNFIEYAWHMIAKKQKQEQARTVVTIRLDLIPTDPYTYGCGVDSLDLFRSKNVKVEILEGGVTSCTVNPYVTSPVGFYCPKGYTLEPANCFTDMVHNDTGLVEPLSKYAPHARPIDSKHIRVVDFTVPHSLKHLVKYSNDRLSCICRDNRGTLRASITLDLRSPNDDDVGALY
ncbi:uncharacterized protein BcabD6B2_31030 [Babesia caballi]|uniref:6-Cys domain-containing protein n=1 Tax=Babesia caballi TaxID=5871 RepID=A0AAV4LUM5_BABCB|nr:hypothetical protein BcabD6B2_31030 [Babesia caballi]